MSERLLLTLCNLLLVCGIANAQTCNSATQYDMLDWMAPQLGTVNGHYNVVFPSSGTFYWVKGANGFPWDVDLFDQNGIYQDRTENIWTNPSTFKQFVTPRKWTSRCVPKSAPNNILSSIQHPTADTQYRIYTSCTSYTNHFLNNGLNQVIGPQILQIGQLPPTPTLSLTWFYGCDAAYGNCQYHEVFDLQQGNGLVRWTYSVRQSDGTYKQQNQTIHDVATVGSVQPVHPCW